MKTFKQVVSEQLRGNYTSPTAGQTWSPASNMEPYKAMTGPIGNMGGNIPGNQDIVNDEDIPLHLPFPLSTVIPPLANAYLSLSQVEYNLKSAKDFNPSIQGARSDILDQQLQKIKALKESVANMREEIKEISKALDSLALNA